MSRMTDSAVTDFPEPDSPTTASVPPSWRSNETSLTAMKSSNATVRPRTESLGPDGFGSAPDGVLTAQRPRSLGL